MGRRRELSIMLIFLCVYCMPGFASAAEETKAINLDAKVVYIDMYKGLDPAVITAKRGTTVVWVNSSHTPHEILFLDKKVVLACGAPVNFFIGKDGGFESAKIPFGGSASLCFTEKGKYKYKLMSSATFYHYEPVKKKDIGSIIIN